MHKTEATHILADQLRRLRAMSYEELCQLVAPDQVETFEVVGDCGTSFEVDIGTRWENAPGGPLRVIVEVDDYGEDRLLPVSHTFAIAPDGQLTE